MKIPTLTDVTSKWQSVDNYFGVWNFIKYVCVCVCVCVHMHVSVYIHVTYTHTRLWKLPDFTDTTPRTWGNLYLVMTTVQDRIAACFDPSLNAGWKINPAVNALATSKHLSHLLLSAVTGELQRPNNAHTNWVISLWMCHEAEWRWRVDTCIPHTRGLYQIPETQATFSMVTTANIFEWAVTVLLLVTVKVGIENTTFTAALLTIAKTWNQPNCPSTDEHIKKIWHTYTHTMEY